MPGTALIGAPTVALIHNDQVKKVAVIGGVIVFSPVLHLVV